jgi:hypothetical protein
MLASGHAIDPPSAFDIVILILWSRLGTLPRLTAGDTQIRPPWYSMIDYQ